MLRTTALAVAAVSAAGCAQATARQAAVVPAPHTVPHVAAVQARALPAAPAAGECEAALPGPEAVVELASDLPYPRCQVVRPTQRLRLVNTTGLEGEAARTLVFAFAGTTYRLAPGDEVVVAAHLRRGVSRVAAELYAGSGAELWVRG